MHVYVLLMFVYVFSVCLYTCFCFCIRFFGCASIPFFDMHTKCVYEKLKIVCNFFVHVYKQHFFVFMSKKGIEAHRRDVKMHVYKHNVFAYVNFTPKNPY